MEAARQSVPARRIVLLLINIFTLCITLVMNVLAQSLPLNGLRTDEISALYPNLFVPAGFTFTIWALIYFLLIVNQVYQIATVRNHESGHMIELLGNLLFAVHLLNASWIAVWHYLYTFVPASVAVMLLLLVFLSLLYVRAREHCSTLLERIMVLFPFSIYLGWIMVAAVANIAAALSTIVPETLRAYEPYITIGTLVIVALLYLIITLTQKDIWIPAVGIWALYGIYSRHVSEGAYPMIARTSLYLIGTIALGVLITLLIKGRHASQEES